MYIIPKSNKMNIPKLNASTLVFMAMMTVAMILIIAAVA